MKPRVEITGVDDVNELLTKIAPKQAKNIMRATVHGIAGTIRDDAKSFAPKDEGTLKKSIKAKRERGKPGLVVSTVRVLRRAFYWRFLEYGRGPDGVEHAMFMRAIEKYRANKETVFLTQFAKKWEAALKRAAKRNGR